MPTCGNREREMRIRINNRRLGRKEQPSKQQLLVQPSKGVVDPSMGGRA